ncbi:hypothetical protein [Methanolobus halotolerans]|uniref:hypothetical protein n=1 Tax=Methanolobus halotolerans TaxID=2052935 RepID=UPI00143681C8|nr:hypothetical protein [Methanolobus halotolerans]
MNKIDTYTGLKETERTSVTYRVSIAGDADATKVNDDIVELLCGIGCKLRI